jgi:hypothetical protein
VKKGYYFVGLVILAFFFTNCNSNRFNVDTAEVNINLEYKNLDSILQVSSEKELISLRKKFIRKKSDILAYNVSYCFRSNLENDTAYINGTRRFYSNPYIKELEKEIEKNQLFNTDVKQRITNGFKRLKYFCPKEKIPTSIYQINSSFSSSVFCSENEIAIGIERYLGPENKLIKQLPSQDFYSWIKESMRKEYIERDIMAAWLMTHYVEETTENFSSEMIRWGKILFITKVCLPEISENDILRFNQKQFDWAVNSEKSMWKYLIENEVLFKIDEETRVNLLNEGPFSIGLPEESPDRMGQYMGYKIVSKFMDESKKSIYELINTPYNEILQKYK